MEEVRLDLREQSQERIAESARCARLCYEYNRTPPMTAEGRAILNELLHGELADDTHIFAPVMLNVADDVHIGRNVVIMNGLQVMAAGGLTIEDDVRISLNCTIATNNHDPYDRDILLCKRVVIKRNAWLGVNVTILPGVTIGQNAIVGAGAVVTKDIPDNAVAVGNPAKVIKYLDGSRFE